MGLNWMKSILEPDARTEKRHAMTGLVACYWDGGAPRMFPVLNISLGGIYVQTEERWYPGTMIKMILQRSPLPAATRSEPGPKAPTSICVLAQVVRPGPDGVGLKFVFAGTKRVEWKMTYPECATDRRTVRTFLDQFAQSRAPVERAGVAAGPTTTKETQVSR